MRRKQAKNIGDFALRCRPNVANPKYFDFVAVESEQGDGGAGRCAPQQVTGSVEPYYRNVQNDELDIVRYRRIQRCPASLHDVVAATNGAGDGTGDYRKVGDDKRSRHGHGGVPSPLTILRRMVGGYGSNVQTAPTRRACGKGMLVRKSETSAVTFEIPNGY